MGKSVILMAIVDVRGKLKSKIPVLASKHLRDCNLFAREQADNFDPRMKPKENVSVVYREIRKTVIYPLNREIDHFDQDK